MMEKIYDEWMGRTQREKIKKILENVDVKGKVLDLGSGPGYLSEFLSDVVSLDKNIEYLKMFSGKRVLADINFLPFKDEVFDAVLCIDAFHFFRNDPTEIMRIIKPHGVLVISQFFNKTDFEEKKNEIKEKFSRYKILKEFVITTEKESDYVLVIGKDTKHFSQEKSE